VGSVSRFYDANIKVLRRELRSYMPGKEEKPGFLVGERTQTNSAVVTPPVLLGDNVYLGQNVELGPDVVIGDGCRIGDGAVIRRTVMMGDCRIGDYAEADRSVLGPHCRVAGGVKLPPHTVLGPYGVGGAEAWPNWAEEVG
jgi:NDP-sugar pyrophosphorylase family protein